MERSLPSDTHGLEVAVHAAAIRRLARHLVRDDATADDVAQETMRTGLERRPKEGWPVGSWLLGVAKNVARNVSRGERRRVARERAAARADGSPSAADAVVRVEQHRRLAQAVLALAEPFRTAVALRYFDGLPPRAIARRTGVPVETARSRTRRALELLRADLDRRHGGDRRTWLVALAPLGRRSPGDWLTDALGGLAMGAGAKAAVASVVIVAGVIALWRPWADDAGNTVKPVVDSKPSPTSELAAADGALEGHPRPSSAASPNAVSPSTAPAVTGPSIRGRVVDAAGRGIKGARVVATPDTASETFDLQGDGGAHAPEAITADDGHFVVSALSDAPTFDLVARADGFATRIVPFVRAVDETVITLGPGRWLVGRVVSMDGDPLAGATISLRDVLGVAIVRRDVVSAADGRYRIDAMPDSGWSSIHRAAIVTREGFAPLLVTQFPTVRPSEGELTLDLVMGRGADVVGRVVDDESGAPVADARVVLWSIESNLVSSRGSSGTSVASPWNSRRLGDVVSAVDGTFRFSHVPAEGFHPLGAYNSGRRGKTLGYVGASKAGWAWGTDEIPFVREGGSIDAEIRLRRPAAISGRVVDKDGKPVALATVYARALEGARDVVFPPDGVAGPLSKSRGVTDADGRYRLDGVPAPAAAAAEFTVAARRAREDSSEYTPTPRETKVAIRARAGDDVTAPNLVLEPPSDTGPRVVVIASDADGKPLWGASVAPARGFLSSPYYGLRTDQDGRLAIRLPPAVQRRNLGALVVRAAGLAEAPLALPDDVRDGAEVRVTLGLAHRVTGRVRRADGTPAAGAIVSAFAARDRDASADARSLLVIGFTEADGDGAFALTGLSSGSFDLRAAASSVGLSAPEGLSQAPGIGFLAGVAADAVDVQLTLSPEKTQSKGRLIGTVLDAETGKPIALFSTTLTRAGDSADGTPKLAHAEGGSTLWTMPTIPYAQRTSVGRFEAQNLEPGDYEVVVKAEGYLLARVEHVAVVDGTLDLPAIRLSKGVRVSGTARAPDGGTWRDLVVTLRGPLPLAGGQGGKFPVGADGTFEATGILPGRYRIVSESSTWQSPTSGPQVLVAVADVNVPDGVAETKADVSLVIAGILVVRLDDPRLPPSVIGPPATATQREFGRGSSLALLAADGHLVANTPSLERGNPPEFLGLALAPGTYVARLTMPGGETVERRVEVAAGAITEVRIGPGR